MQIVRMTAGLVLVIVLAAGIAAPPAAAAPPAQNSEWPVSTPEQQGMDSTPLAALFELIQAEAYEIDSVLIIRHGTIVADAYRYPYTADRLHVQYSITKSVIATLVGIAIDQGLLDGVNTPLLEFFPEYTISDADAKSAITLEHALTMSAGLDWEDDGTMIYRMIPRQDWVEFVLNLPLTHDPGTHFAYNSGLPHVLSAVLEQVTGMSTAAYAEQVLFGPLGITDYDWETDRQGITNGGWGLWLAPHDMAKLGTLYLHDGVWEDEPIVSPDWVEAATAPHIDATDPGERYGYLWWLGAHESFTYSARGLGGQYIFVIPDYDLVVVITSDPEPGTGNLPKDLLADYILPAVDSDEPLPPNPTAAAALEAQIKALAQP
jgi:CubicO group peptidase (beta-lactamase class C family)